MHAGRGSHLPGMHWQHQIAGIGHRLNHILLRLGLPFFMGEAQQSSVCPACCEELLFDTLAMQDAASAEKGNIEG